MSDWISELRHSFVEWFMQEVKAMDTMEELIRRECNMADELVAVIVIQCDEIIHTTEQPYCGDETCPCMDELYAEVDRWEQHEPGDERYYR